MKTSRLARDTATIGKNAEVVARRRTRGFAAAINGFAAGDTPGGLAVKQEDESDNDSSPLSSLGSPGPFDIEDVPSFIDKTPPKRKRGISTPTTTTTTLTETSSLKRETRISPRKAAIKTDNGSSSSAKITKGKKDPARKVIDQDSGDVTIHPPSHWEETYALVQEMRKKTLAPVDTMGCESLAEETRSPRVRSNTHSFPPVICTHTTHTQEKKKPAPGNAPTPSILTSPSHHRTNVSKPSSP